MTPSNPIFVYIQMEAEEENNKLLQAELKWIDDNANRYDSLWHCLAVKNNIVKRYQLDRYKKEISSLKGL